MCETKLMACIVYAVPSYAGTVPPLNHCKAAYGTSKPRQVRFSHNE